MKALLIYPISTDYAPNAGIIHKMEQQTAAFRALGFNALQLHTSRNGLCGDGQLVSPYWPKHPAFAPLHHRLSFYRKAYGVLARWRPDLIYLRYPLSTPATVSFIKAVKSELPRSKLVVEVPTYPYDQEAETIVQRVTSASDKALRRILKHWVDMVVTFHGRDEIFGIPCLQTANGISPEAITHRANRPTSGPIRAIAVANLARWHGYDRLIEGMVGTPDSEFKLRFVGDGPAKADLERLVRDRGLCGQVDFLGVRRGAELDELFEDSDVGIGSLGDHRRGLNVASSLKAREYCARGMPFVFSTSDPDFPPGHGGWLQLPANDRPIPLGKVVALANESRRSAALGQALRRYAEDRLTWQAKLTGLLNRLDVGAYDRP
jgi:glycosyltransferase involved in cell wall biosynthesis